MLLRAETGSVVLLQHRAVFMICAITKDSVEAHDPADFQEQGGFFCCGMGMVTDAQLRGRDEEGFCGNCYPPQPLPSPQSRVG